jgi:hypothetical protein
LITKPYVGITGVARADEVSALIAMLDRLSWPDDRLLMIGVCISDKSLEGETISERRRSRYPAPASLRNLFTADPRVLNLVHFNSRSTVWPKQLDQILKLVPNCNGFQLNMMWPDVATLRNWHSNHPELSLVLQVGSGAIDLLRTEKEPKRIPSLLSRRLQEYEGLVDAVLFDPSGGLGLSFFESEMATCLAKLSESGLNLAAGAAGGLESSTVELLYFLRQRLPKLNWDAEGRLRTGDALDLAKCYSYLARSRDLFMGWMQPPPLPASFEFSW